MKTKNATEKTMKVCLVGSSGGHLTHLYEENRKVSSRTKARTVASSEVFGEWRRRTCQGIRHRAELQHD